MISANLVRNWSSLRFACAATVALIAICAIPHQASAQNNPVTPTAPAAPATELQDFARGFGGASVLVQDRRTGNYVPNIALGAVIDDDVASGWMPPNGETRILIQLYQMADLDSVSVYAPEAVGTYSIHLATSLDQIQNDAMTLVSADLPLSGTPKTKLPGSPATYLVIQLEITRAAPIRGVQATGKPTEGALAAAVVVSPGNNADSEDTAAEGEIAEVNFALRSIGGQLPEADEQLFSHALIDGDTATYSQLSPAAGAKSVNTTIRLASVVDVDRVTLAIGPAIGNVSIFTADADGNLGRMLSSVHVDGSTETMSFETDGVRAEFVQLIWTPQVAGTPLQVREVGVFALARVQRSNSAATGAVVVNIVPAFGASPPSLPAGMGISPRENSPERLNLPTDSPVALRPVSA